MKNEYSEEFETLWQLYPRKDDKYPAYKIFKRLKKNEPEEIPKLRQWLENYQFKGEKRFFKYFKTVLNNKTWQEFTFEEIEKTKQINQAQKEFDLILNFIRRKGVDSPDTIQGLSDRGLQALRAIGGRRSIGLVNDYELEKVRADFVNKY